MKPRPMVASGGFFWGINSPGGNSLPGDSIHDIGGVELRVVEQLVLLWERCRPGLRIMAHAYLFVYSCEDLLQFSTSNCPLTFNLKTQSEPPNCPTVVGTDYNVLTLLVE